MEAESRDAPRLSVPVAHHPGRLLQAVSPLFCRRQSPHISPYLPTSPRHLPTPPVGANLAPAGGGRHPRGASGLGAAARTLAVRLTARSSAPQVTAEPHYDSHAISRRVAQTAAPSTIPSRVSNPAWVQSRGWCGLRQRPTSSSPRARHRRTRSCRRGWRPACSPPSRRRRCPACTRARRRCRPELVCARLRSRRSRRSCTTREADLEGHCRPPALRHLEGTRDGVPGRTLVLCISRRSRFRARARPAGPCAARRQKAEELERCASDPDNRSTGLSGSRTRCAQ